MKVTIYGIRNCDTMKKAFGWLQGQGVDYRFHDYRRDGVPSEHLREWAKKAGWEKLVNTRGTMYRRIPDQEKAGLDETRALRLLEKYPSAIRRPVVEAGAKLLVGFDPADFARTLGR